MKNYYINGYLVCTDLCTGLVGQSHSGTAVMFNLVSFLTYSEKNRFTEIQSSSKQSGPSSTGGKASAE